MKKANNMNYIDLLSDSDDDIPLIPTAGSLNRSKVPPTSNGVFNNRNLKSGPTFTAVKAQNDNQVDLLTSSDEDEPILKRPRPSLQANNAQFGGPNKVLQQGVIDVDEYGSDKTEKYSDDVLSDATEKYGSDSDSLPDISLGDIPPPEPDCFDYGNDIPDDDHEKADIRSHSPSQIDPLPASDRTTFNPAISAGVSLPLKRPAKSSSSTSCDVDSYTKIKVCFFSLLTMIIIVNILSLISV